MKTWQTSHKSLKYWIDSGELGGVFVEGGESRERGAQFLY
jgi:hypothetical protein